LQGQAVAAAALEEKYQRQMSKLAEERVAVHSRQVQELSDTHAQQIKVAHERNNDLQKQLADNVAAHEAAMDQHRQHAQACEAMALQLKDKLDQQQQQHERQIQAAKATILELTELLANAQARCKRICSNHDFLNLFVLFFTETSAFESVFNHRAFALIFSDAAIILSLIAVALAHLTCRSGGGGSIRQDS
jgi:chromatin segregation and condensation protein Rec8/ScpA/Scc1 (kleisin family)